MATLFHSKAVLLIGITSFVVIYGQVASLCRSNESFLSCGCARTCEHPEPCQDCREGCFCPDHLVRNSTGHCVPIHECPYDSAARSAMRQTDPRLRCGEHEEFDFCSCSGWCSLPKPTCTTCERGCSCSRGYLRNHAGRCVPSFKCPKTTTESPIVEAKGKPPVQICGKNEVFEFCGVCHRTCDNPNPICPAQCTRGCFCKDGYVRGADQKCVKENECPQASGVVEVSEMKQQPPAQLCPKNEEFQFCGVCHKTCENPNPVCPAQCARGCFCKEGWVRGADGTCVKELECPQAKCIDQNAQYSCRNPCEEFCSGRPCSLRASRCVSACYCKLGFLKDDISGKCIKPKYCPEKKLEFDAVQI